MAISKTQTSCPNCRQPLVVDVEQLYNVDEDPQAKQRLLGGGSNMIQCPSCGYQGAYSTPIVYHDSEKELLLSFVPPELGLPLDQQERVIGPLINKVVNSLPQEKRKAYLLQPKTMLQRQTIMETILAADGITKEMIEAQQARMSLLQRLASVTSDDVLETIVKQEEKLIDQEFFTLLNALVQNALAGGDRNLAQRLTQIQEKLLPLTEFGRKLQAESDEVEIAIQELQALGDRVTRDSLLDLVANATNESRLRAYVSMVRQGMDYQFFEMLSERVDRARGDGRKRLSKIRDQLLSLTQQYDQQVQLRVAQIREVIDALVKEDRTREATMQIMSAVDNLFIQVLQQEIAVARRDGDIGRSGKLNLIMQTIQEASAPPPELEFIETLLEISDDAELKQTIEDNSSQVTPNLIDMLSALVGQFESSGNTAGVEAISRVYNHVLRFSMKNQMKTTE